MDFRNYDHLIGRKVTIDGASVVVRGFEGETLEVSTPVGVAWVSFETFARAVYGG